VARNELSKGSVDLCNINVAGSESEINGKSRIQDFVINKKIILEGDSTHGKKEVFYTQKSGRSNVHSFGRSTNAGRYLCLDEFW
jgi:hypothetical protein